MFKEQAIKIPSTTARLCPKRHKPLPRVMFVWHVSVDFCLEKGIDSQNPENCLSRMFPSKIKNLAFCRYYGIAFFP